MTDMKNKRTLLKSLAALAMAATAGMATAQGAADGYPNKPVTIITPFAAGSGPDAVMRMVGEVLSKKWMQRCGHRQPARWGWLHCD